MEAHLGRHVPHVTINSNAKRWSLTTQATQRASCNDSLPKSPKGCTTDTTYLDLLAWLSPSQLTIPTPPPHHSCLSAHQMNVHHLCSTIHSRRPAPHFQLPSLPASIPPLQPPGTLQVPSRHTLPPHVPSTPTPIHEPNTTRPRRLTVLRLCLTTTFRVQSTPLPSSSHQPVPLPACPSPPPD